MNKIQDILTKGSKAVDFWNLQLDGAYNFSYYFKEYNPNRLDHFKLTPQKKKAKQTVFGAFAFKASLKKKGGMRS